MRLNYWNIVSAIRAYTFLISYFLYIINIIFDFLFAIYIVILIVNIMYYVYSILYCIVYIGIVTHVKYISWTAQTDHAVTFPTSLISRYVLCCVLFFFVFFYFVYNLCMLYISIFCIFCRFFCLLTIKIFFPKKRSIMVTDITQEVSWRLTSHKKYHGDWHHIRSIMATDIT